MNWIRSPRRGHQYGRLAGAVMPPPVESVEVTPRHLRIGDGYTATLAVVGYPADVGPGWLEPLLSVPGRVDLAVHIDPLPAPVAAARLRTRRTRLESARRHDTDHGRLTNPVVDAAADDAADLADRIARGAANLFRVGVYLTVHARTPDALTEACAHIRAAAAAALLDVRPVTWRHLHGWTSTLPVGHDALRLHRTMDTAALAAAFPLASPDLPQPDPGQGVLYGVNPASAGVLRWDRWTQDNHNMVVLGPSGSGKSYLVKLELLRHLYTGVHAAVIDPDDEYQPLADAAGGVTIRLGAPDVRVNPFDLPAGGGPDTVARRGLFLHTLIGLLLARADQPAPPTPDEAAALDRGILAAYRQAGITTDPATHHRPAPLLRDLAGCLHADPDPAGRAIAARLSPWVDGTHRHLFDGPTSHPPRSHLTVWSLRHLPDETRPVGMLVALDAVWAAIDRPATAAPVRRLVVVDEAWQLMHHPPAARFLYRMGKAARKRRAGLTLVTQDTADLLATDLGRAVIANAATHILMRQTPQAVDAVAGTYHLTTGERHLLLTAGRGTGLLVAGTHRTGLHVLASPTEHTLLTTQPAGPPVDRPAIPASTPST